MLITYLLIIKENRPKSYNIYYFIASAKYKLRLVLLFKEKNLAVHYGATTIYEVILSK